MHLNHFTRGIYRNYLYDNLLQLRAAHEEVDTNIFIYLRFCLLGYIARGEKEYPSKSAYTSLK